MKKKPSTSASSGRPAQRFRRQSSSNSSAISSSLSSLLSSKSLSHSHAVTTATHSTAAALLLHSKSNHSLSLSMSARSVDSMNSAMHAPVSSIYRNIRNKNKETGAKRTTDVVDVGADVGVGGHANGGSGKTGTKLSRPKTMLDLFGNNFRSKTKSSKKLSTSSAVKNESNGSLMAKSVKSSNFASAESLSRSEISLLGALLKSKQNRNNGNVGQIVSIKENNSTLGSISFNKIPKEKPSAVQNVSLASKFERPVYKRLDSDKSTNSASSLDSNSSSASNNSAASWSSFESLKSTESFRKVKDIFRKLDGNLANLKPKCLNAVCLNFNKRKNVESVDTELCEECLFMKEKERQFVVLVVENVAKEVQNIVDKTRLEAIAKSNNLCEVKMKDSSVDSAWDELELDVFDVHEEKGEELCPLNITDFLFRLVKYMQIWFDKSIVSKGSEIKENAGIHCLFMMLVYLYKLVQNDFSDIKPLEFRPHANIKGRNKYSKQAALYFKLTDRNVFNVLLGCFLVAAKYSEDEVISNKWWAKVGNVTLQKVNIIEMEICKRIGFGMFVKDTAIADMYNKYVPQVIYKSKQAMQKVDVRTLDQFDHVSELNGEYMLPNLSKSHNENDHVTVKLNNERGLGTLQSQTKAAGTLLNI